MTDKPPEDEERCYYILDSRTVVGNCASWWCPDGKGYTCDLNAAGLYTEREANGYRETDIAVHRDGARRLSVTHVRLDWMRDDPDLADAFARARPKRARNR